jgi:hypothetical protein
MTSKYINVERIYTTTGLIYMLVVTINISRVINILGVPELIAKLKKWNSPYKAKVLLWLKIEYLKCISVFVFGQTKLAT